MTGFRARALCVLAALASVASAAVAIAAGRGGARLPVALVAAALAWSAIPASLDVLGGAARRAPVARLARRRGGTPRCTTIVHVGGQSREVTRATLAVTAHEGPTIVVSSRPEDLDGLPDDVCVVLARDAASAMRDAASLVRTPAAIIVSAGAIIDPAACHAAAGLLQGDVGWVTGTVRTFNRDGYGPGVGEDLAARARADIRASGGVLWEPDATIVRTDLLREHEWNATRPRGAWLRGLAARGLRGVEVEEVLAMCAVPADAGAFWASSVQRSRGSVADLANALRFGPMRSRVRVLAQLLRELYALPLTFWLLLPVLASISGGFPLALPLPAALGLVVGPAMLRWTARRARLGARRHPVDDAWASVYGTVRSLMAVPAALTRRVRAPRWDLPNRPLTWAALAFTASIAATLLGSGTRAPDRTTSALAVVELVALWVLAVRGLLQRTWGRSMSRVPMRTHVTVGTTPGTSIDASPNGLAVAGAFVDVALLDRVPVHIADDRAPLDVHARVAARRVRADGTVVLGLSLEIAPADRGRWLSMLYQCARDRYRAGAAGGATGEPLPPHRLPRRPVARVVDAIGLTAAAVLSAAVCATIAVLILGYQPLVVRSGSMRPAIAVGDLVMMTNVPASEVRLGDVVSFPDPSGAPGTISHRVQAIEVDGATRWFETRGDANRAAERWAAPQDAVLRRVSWRVPAGGLVLYWCADHRWALLGAALAVILLGTRARRPLARPAVVPGHTGG